MKKLSYGLAFASLIALSSTTSVHAHQQCLGPVQPTEGYCETWDEWMTGEISRRLTAVKAWDGADLDVFTSNPIDILNAPPIYVPEVNDFDPSRFYEASMFVPNVDAYPSVGFPSLAY